MLGFLGMSLDTLSNFVGFLSLSVYLFICVVEVLNLAIRACQLICYVVSQV